MDTMFEDFFDREHLLSPRQELLTGPQSYKENALLTNNYRKPVANIYENEKNIIAEIEMPGLDKKDIQIEFDKNNIRIKAETRSELKQEDKKKGMYRLERNYSGFFRQFSLPENINIEKATAEYKDGILTVTMPKLRLEESKHKRIEVK